MKALLLAIIEAVKWFFKWRANATDPETKKQAAYEEEYKAWKQKLERLQREESEINAVIENRIAAAHAGVTDDWRDTTTLELQAIVERRRKAVATCRGQEPRNPSVQQG